MKGPPLDSSKLNIIKGQGRYTWQEIEEHLALLKLVSQIADEAQSSKTAYEQSANLLTALHNLLTRASLLDSPQGRILLHSSAPKLTPMVY